MIRVTKHNEIFFCFLFDLNENTKMFDVSSENMYSKEH